MRLADIGETSLITSLSKKFATLDTKVVKGIGDDASVTLVSPDKCLVTTVDVLVEGIHFVSETAPPRLLGRKLVSISVSDIAAMGATPTSMLLLLSLPSSLPVAYVDSICDGIRERLAELSISLIGGNTSSSPDAISIGSVMLGEVARDKVVYRKGAVVGDTIYVTGFLGDAALGLSLLQSCRNKDRRNAFNSAETRHLDPSPRLKVGQLLARKGLVTAMIDISDGLIQDVRHILHQSCIGASIRIPELPLSNMMKEHIENKREDIYMPLTGGEDYELLFTSPPEKIKQVLSLSNETGVTITPIGEITGVEDDIAVIDEEGNKIRIGYEGFNHFRNPEIDP